jgi:3-oxoacyl-[acyl-carrier protein] reductase
MNHLLANQVAIVTGGSSGIGRAIACCYAKAGAKVAIIGRDESKLQSVIQEMASGRNSNDFIGLSANVSDPVSMSLALDQIIQKWGRCDILVNNAGSTQDGLLMKMSEDQWDEVITVNLKSIFLSCRHLIRVMLKQKHGSIINVSSVSGLMGNAGQCNYAAAKAGMIGFTKSLAKEVASRSIRVNVLAPGFVTTPMTESLSSSLESNYKNLIPLGRFAQAEEIAQVALFLASHMSSYITGQVLSVDGGLYMA